MHNEHPDFDPHLFDCRDDFHKFPADKHRKNAHPVGKSGQNG